MLLPVAAETLSRRWRYSAAVARRALLLVLGADGAGPRRERRFGAAGATDFERRLQPLARRLRARRVLEYLPYALLLAGLVAFTCSLLGRAFTLPGLYAVGWLAAIATVVGSTVRVARQPVGPYHAARSVDAALALRERLGTALELIDSGAEGPLVERQLRDAAAAVGGVSPQSAFPYFARGSAARRVAARRGGLATAALAGAIALSLWPAGAVSLTGDATRDKLAMAQPQQDDQALQRQLRPIDDGDQAEGIEGRTQRPTDLGDVSGALTENKPNAGQNSAQQGAQGDDRGQQAQQDARNQQNSSVADRQQALQDLSNALRQSQTARPAADSLKRGDTQKASQQLQQLADQASKLSPGERQSLAQAFQQAAEQIGSRDQSLADASKRASDALSQFRTQDAQKAIRDAADQVKATGQQAQQQKDLEQRAQDLAKGGQPQLPQSPQLGDQQQGQQGQSQQRAQAAQNQGQGQNSATRQGGEGNEGAGGLSELEAALRSGGLQQGSSGGDGAGNSAGSGQLGAASRLNVEGRPVTVEAEVGDGPTQWRPPSPNAVAALTSTGTSGPGSGSGAGNGAGGTGGSASTAPIGGGADVNNVPWDLGSSAPWDLASAVRQYFTPDPAVQTGQAAPASQGQAAPAPAGQRK